MNIYENLDLQDLENEIWKTIEEYPDYEVSNFGRIKSLKFEKEKILRQCKGNRGYFQIDLYKNKKSKTKYVHRLVHEAHKEKLEEGYDAHHINGDEEYNFVENLESKPHEKHMSEHRKGKHHSEETRKKMSENHADFKGENHPNHKLSNQDIFDIQSDIEKEIYTQVEIANKYSVSQMTVSRIKNGKY